MLIMEEKEGKNYLPFSTTDFYLHAKFKNNFFSSDKSKIQHNLKMRAFCTKQYFYTPWMDGKYKTV